MPYLKAAKELKTKPTQHSVKMLQQVGIQPDVLVLRTEKVIPPNMLRKVAQFCNVQPEAVTQSLDVPTIYQVPLMMHEQHLDDIVLSKMGVENPGEPDLGAWNEFLKKLSSAEKVVKIGLVGKYVELQDAYKSINESLLQAATYCDHKVEIEYIHSEKVSSANVVEKLEGVDGVIIAPGFGQRGIEGKFVAIKYCREHDVPTFGICLGMQCMVIEYGRNVLGLTEANSVEMDPHVKDNVIDLMEEQKSISNLGGTMRLGAYPCKVLGDIMKTSYGTDEISERHRHRYEFNNDYREEIEKAGMKIAGTSPDGTLVEAVEIPSLDFYIGVQFHPEFKSRPQSAHPIFREFIKHAVKYSQGK